MLIFIQFIIFLNLLLFIPFFILDLIFARQTVLGQILKNDWLGGNLIINLLFYLLFAIFLCGLLSGKMEINIAIKFLVAISVFFVINKCIQFLLLKIFSHLLLKDYQTNPEAFFQKYAKYVIPPIHKKNKEEKL